MSSISTLKHQINETPFLSVENQRRTRYFSLTSNPEWNQTMVYPNLQPADLAKRHLEVTAWNYQPDRPNEYLGEVVLDLSGKKKPQSFSDSVNCIPTHALSHSFSHSFTETLIYSFIHCFFIHINSFSHSLTHSFIHCVTQ